MPSVGRACRGGRDEGTEERARERESQKDGAGKTERRKRAETRPEAEAEGGRERQKLREAHSERRTQRLRAGGLLATIKLHPDGFNASIPLFSNLDFQVQGSFGFLALPQGTQELSCRPRLEPASPAAEAALAAGLPEKSLDAQTYLKAYSESAGAHGEMHMN